MVSSTYWVATYTKWGMSAAVRNGHIGYPARPPMADPDDGERDPDRGARIRQLRKAKGFTSAAALAQAVGVHPRTVDNWESGRPIDGPNLNRLAQALDTSAGLIWSGEDGEAGRPVALRAHDKRVREDLDAILSELGRIREQTAELASLLPDLVAETRDLRATTAELQQAVAELRRREAGGSQSGTGS
jgi:transcriptional regulator with XRE-family HTH domain